MKNYIYLIVFSLILFSCNKEKNQTISKANFSIDLPSDLSETKELNDVASLQFQNIYSEFYVLVIDEKKKDLTDFYDSNEINNFNLDSYCELLKGIMPILAGNDFSKIHTQKINGMNAKVFSLETKIEDIDAFYEFGFFESKTTFYQVMVWTLLDKKAEHEPKMLEIINSFKEIGINHQSAVK